ncbi:fatty acyl-AMP ligase [Actinomadura atramentaria]|uniref:fatty acyl-AMP ligase n=1 Tax=Actinomadura atramentaria TaxID=1990 RepID=UPI00037EF3D6|nr:fatty acyl-AMP ligase [Actinomadura atramentaria]
METISELLSSRAAERGDATAFTFLADGGRAPERISHSGLDRAARAVAARLAERCAPGDRVLILAVDNARFVRAFLGCQHAGVIAVPVALPFPPDSPRRLATLRAIAADSEPAAVLSDLPGCPWPDEPVLAAPPWIAIPDDPDGADGADGFTPVATAGDDVSFLQYTSGSTSLPKGVMVTHRSLLANEALFTASSAMTPDDTLVSWLPLFHDMGLIGKVLQTVYVGAHAVLMPPLMFARRPLRWLQAITEYRGTFTGAPNFAFDLCVARIPEADRAALDLGSLRMIFSGAEPVRAATLDAFARAFAPAGLHPEALTAGYGLAEVTLLVSSGPIERGARVLDFDRDALHRGVLAPGGGGTIVSCGRPRDAGRVTIVDPATRRPLPDGEVGEIWLRGPDVAAGYWRDPEATAEVFGAHTADGAGPYLRTGDLGALHDGELYVTGRLKDVVIIEGRNHYPQDLELAAETADPALRRGGAAAFGVDRDGREGLVVVAEIRDRERVDAVRRSIAAALSAAHGVQADEIVLVAPGTVPKTSSGKLQRGACRVAYERGELVPVGGPPQVSPIP